MKHVLWLCVLISATSFADSGSNSAKSWIKNILAGKSSNSIRGQTAQGQPCGLFLTDNQNNVFSLAVSSLVPLASVELAITEKTNVIYDPSFIFFTDAHTVAVQMDESGSPVRAVGANGHVTIDCQFK